MFFSLPSKDNRHGSGEPREEGPGQGEQQVDSHTGVQQVKFSRPEELGIKLAEQAQGGFGTNSPAPRGPRPYPSWSWHSPWRAGCRRCAAGALL